MTHINQGKHIFLHLLNWEAEQLAAGLFLGIPLWVGIKLSLMSSKLRVLESRHKGQQPRDKTGIRGKVCFQNRRRESSPIYRRSDFPTHIVCSCASTRPFLNLVPGYEDALFIDGIWGKVTKVCFQNRRRAASLRCRSARLHSHCLFLCISTALSRLNLVPG